MTGLARRTRRAAPLSLPALLAVALLAGIAPSTRAAAVRHAAAGTCGGQVLGIAQGFNVFVQHDYSVSNTDVKGRAAAGGNVSITSYAVGVDLTPDASRLDLIAGGSLTVGGGGAQAPKGSVSHGGALQGSITTPVGSVSQAAPPFDIDAEFTKLAAQSQAIAALAPNGTAGGPAYAYDLIGTSSDTNVFTLAASSLETAQVIRINVPLGSSTVVNVTGSAYSTARFPTAAIQFWNGSSYVQLPDSAPPNLEALRANLLWNFPAATSVQIGPNLAWQGTVLAPLANVVFPGSTQLNGTLIAKTLVNSQGSARNHPYTGCVPVAPPTPALEAVDDQYGIQQPEKLTIAAPGVLANDVVPAGATASVELASGVAHGTLKLAADGSFTYTAATGFAGADRFTYRIHQGSATSNTATVTIDVSARKAKLVTFVARVCPTYTDVMANLARNDIQESLQDLGPDSAYQSGQPIDPELEAAKQPACKALPGWQFTLGTGILGRAVSGPWGSLSIVTDPFATHIVTDDETSLLNDQGQPTGRTIAGATTIALTDDQADLAAGSSALWAQGGTPADPILDEPFPGQYGFAALRCGIDNLNGDNVEWIAYPAGASHVFCYAYYVKPPPTSGTIIVRKVVTSPADATQTFTFSGNVTFNADGRFQLAVVDGTPAEATFYRAETTAGEAPWEFTEDVPAGWHLTGIACDSATGASTTSSDPGTARTAVTLAPGDTVTCTYTNSQTPPTGALTITKTTLGGIGTFHYAVTPAGGGSATAAVAKTLDEGVETTASPAAIPLAPGRYSIAETLPSSRRGSWHLTAVSCNGEGLPATSPIAVTITSGGGLVCRFQNTFVPNGSITILKKTIGGVGTARFVIYPPASQGEASVLVQTAKVTKEGVAVRARGDSTRRLALGTYRIQELATGGTTPDGWALTSVVCNGTLVGSSQGAIEVTLTTKKPRLRCLFTNTFTPTPPSPGPSPNPNPDPEPTSELHLTKTADRSTVTVGGIVTYTIRVHNSGDAAAQDVIIAEKASIENAELISGSPSQGICRTSQFPAACYLGTIEPGATVTIIARLRATKVGPLPNTVSVNASTDVVDPPTSGVEGEVVKPPAGPKPRPKPTPPPLTG